MGVLNFESVPARNECLWLRRPIKSTKMTTLSSQSNDSDESIDHDAASGTMRSPRGFLLPPNMGARANQDDPDEAGTAPVQVPAFDFNSLSPEQQMFLLHQAMTAGLSRPVRKLTAPRFGGLDDTGVWTGHGLNDGQVNPEPRTYHCYREFLDTGTKSKYSLGKIREDCMEGLKEKGPHFSLTHEKEAEALIPCIKAAMRFMETNGMDGVFLIVLPSGTTINMFETPALASIDVVKTWVQDLTVDGVHDGRGRRLRVCKYDSVNLSLSGFALLNTCSTLLHDEIVRLIPKQNERTGPRVYYEIIQKMASLSVSYTRTLEEKLKKTKLSDFKGENVQMYAEHCLNIVDEIRMTSLLPDLIPHLPSLILVGLTKASHQAIAHQATLDMAKSNKLFTKSGERISLEPSDILEPYIELWQSLDQMGLYGPSSTTKAMQAMQAQVKDIQKTLEQDKSKKSSGAGSSSGTRTCYECGSPDHLRNKCPKLQQGKGNGKSDKGTTSSSPDRKPYQIPGLSAVDNLEVDKLIKDKLASLKPLHEVPADAKHDIKFKDKVVAKFCRKCKRFLKGDKAHYTSEHRSKGGDGKPPEKPVESATASLAVAAPALMRCEAADYDTPVLTRYTPDSDSDDDSVFQAFMAVAPPEDPLVVPPPPDPPSEPTGQEAEFKLCTRRSRRTHVVYPKVVGGQGSN